MRFMGEGYIYILIQCRMITHFRNNYLKKEPHLTEIKWN